MMKRHQARYLFFLIFLLSSLLSTSLKLADFSESPKLSGFRYTDIEYGVFLDRFYYKADARKWFNLSSIESLKIGTKTCPKAYLDYLFEYPPLIGGIWQFTTCLSIHLTFPEKYSPNCYDELIQGAAKVNYFLNAMILISFFYLLYRTLRLDYDISMKRAIIFALSPSLIMYLTYNWDIMCIYFFLKGLKLYEVGRLKLSGAMMALSFITKILTFPAILILIIDTLKERRRFASFMMGFFAINFVSWISIMVLSLKGLISFIQYHSGWYCENCIYMLFIRDIFSDYHHYLYIIALILLIGFSLYELRRGADIRLLSFITVAGGITLSYVFTPQMFLLILPLALLCLRNREYLLFTLADFLNASIIVTFFYELNSGGKPWVWGSATQTVAQIRNFILLVLILTLAIFLHKKHKDGSL